MSLLRLLNKCLKLPTDINKIISYMVSDHVFVVGRIYHSLCFTGVKVNGAKVYEENSPFFKVYAIDGKYIYIRQYDKNGLGDLKRRVILKKDGLEAILINYNLFFSNNKPLVNEYIIIPKILLI